MPLSRSSMVHRGLEDLMQAIAARIAANPDEAHDWIAEACASLPCRCPRTELARQDCPLNK